MTQELEKRFTLAMFDVYRRAKDDADYNATKFRDMVQKNGGLATAKTLINASRPSDGYTALWERKRLDLTVEAVVIENEEWWPLFHESEIARSRKRLMDYGYRPSKKD